MEFHEPAGGQHRSTESTTDVLAAWCERCGSILPDEAAGALRTPHLAKVAELFFTDRTDGSSAQETIMAKGQKRSNREIRKPKKKKESVTAPVVLTKGISGSIGIPKKKG